MRNRPDADSTEITLRENRELDGFDRDVPIILRDGRLYDRNLDRFFLDLPLNGIRSRHSLRAYGYDIVVWVRFLEQACCKGVWEATSVEVKAFHRNRRREKSASHVSAASWNRSVAALDKLYRWAEAEKIVAASPFTHRRIWRRQYGSRRAQMIGRNEAYELSAKRADVRFVSLNDFRVFRDLGLRGLNPDGSQRAGARDRNATRNALFAELLVTTGLRLEEASFLLAFEIEELTQLEPSRKQVWFDLPAALTKGNRGRRVLLPRRVLREIKAYTSVERALAVQKFRIRAGVELIARPLFMHRPRRGAATLHPLGGGKIPIQALTPEERGRTVICDDGGTPEEAAALWLTEIGLPVQPNSWEIAFTRACNRCSRAGFPMRVNPHQLRHAFAVHMLAMLIQQCLRGASNEPTESSIDGYRRILSDPLQQVQRLLGHASIETTYIYLDHIASGADTVDTAVEQLLSLIPKGMSLC